MGLVLTALTADCRIIWPFGAGRCRPRKRGSAPQGLRSMFVSRSFVRRFVSIRGPFFAAILLGSI
jgi:hypothetical protein